jgi:hypothetical protein
LLFGSLLAFVERKKSNRLREVMQKAAAISAKPDGVWAGSQPFILAGKRSGLLTHIAATESVSSRERMKTSQPLSNLKELSANHRASESKSHADCLEYLARLLTQESEGTFASKLP